MSAGNMGLGRGLDALLGGVKEDQEVTSDAAEVRMLPLSRIVPNPHQPRREFSPEALNDLAASIETRGVLQPVLVRSLKGGRYELIAGERRMRASKQVGLTEIPALVREMSDQESLAIALIENLQREDLNAIEEALGYQRLQQEFGLSQGELARQVGKSRSAVANSMRLLNLDETTQASIQQGMISAGHGRAIMAVGDDGQRDALRKRIEENGLTVRQAEAQAVFWKENNRLPGAEEVGQVTKPAKKKSPTNVPEELMQVESQLKDLLDLGVKMSGTTDKGKITLSYTSQSQLQSIVEKFGIDLG